MRLTASVMESGFVKDDLSSRSDHGRRVEKSDLTVSVMLLMKKKKLQQFRSFINNITETVRSNFSTRRPWSELLDRSSFTKPDSITDAVSRIRKKYSYFRVNYITVMVVVLGISLVTNPYLFRPSDPPLLIFGRTFSDYETLALLSITSLFVIFLTSVGSLLMSALMIGIAIVSADGAFRTPEDLFLDEQEAGASTGFLSFLSGAAANAAVSAAPVVAAARG